ncbi:MAG: hypothetical protein GYB32_10425 [Algicola sp.]|nr:hypothetical protein [Algicola sp.]
MKPRYALSIPKPCHENWSDMTPSDKGRFCQSCSKTVIDFTTMTASEVQDFIHHHKQQRICGHIKLSQLDTVNLQIYNTVFDERMSFHKLFLLALLLAMGTSLLSCSDNKGQPKKIDSVEIIDQGINSTKTEVEPAVDSSTNATTLKKADSTILKTPKIEATTIPVMGDIVMVEGMMILEEVDPKQPMSWYAVEVPPEFKDTPQGLTIQEKRERFQNKISQFVNDNFKISQGPITLKGRQRIHTQFTIDENGNVNNILVRAPHNWFEKETKRVIELLPQFIPATNDGKPVQMTYNLPIMFDIED